MANESDYINKVFGSYRITAKIASGGFAMIYLCEHVILSEHQDGFTIDAGPDSLLVQKPDGIRLCEELGLRDRLVPTKLPRLAYIQRRGRLPGQTRWRWKTY